MLKRIILITAALFVGAVSYAQSAPPPGAYVAPDGSWYERNGYALPADAGQVESDGTKAADYAEMSEQAQMSMAAALGSQAPRGLTVAIYRGYSDYIKVVKISQPGPPEEKY